MPTAGSSYYQTAAELRASAARARESYPVALGHAGAPTATPVDVIHAGALIFQAVGLEIAAALYCLAQAVQDAGENPGP